MSDSLNGEKRGMHAATGAFWDSTRDGMWSYKFDASEKKGFDVVVNIVWIGLQ
jgi:dynein light chain Tctex-type 1